MKRLRQKEKKREKGRRVEGRGEGSTQQEGKGGQEEEDRGLEFPSGQEGESMCRTCSKTPSLCLLALAKARRHVHSLLSLYSLSP